MTSKFFVQCIIKQLLDSVLVISRIIKVSVRVISLSLRLRLITRTSTLIILDITKTSSNNCLLSPQHYKLNDRQHVLDRKRESVSKRCSKAMQNQQAWGKSLRRLNRTTTLIVKEYITNLVSKGREGGKIKR